MKTTPCEYIVWSVLPCIRKQLAIYLLKKGLTQKEVADRLGVSSAAVSQYLSNKRGVMEQFNDNIHSEIEKSADELLNGKDIIEELCRICNIIKLDSKAR